MKRNIKAEKKNTKKSKLDTNGQKYKPSFEGQIIRI